MRFDHPDPLRGHAVSLVELRDLHIDADQPIEAAQHKTTETSRTRLPALLRSWISARVKRQDGFLPGHQATRQRQRHQARREVAAEMQVRDVVIETPKQA